MSQSAECLNKIASNFMAKIFTSPRCLRMQVDTEGEGQLVPDLSIYAPHMPIQRILLL